jgi:hypothetical protein
MSYSPGSNPTRRQGEKQSVTSTYFYCGALFALLINLVSCSVNTTYPYTQVVFRSRAPRKGSSSGLRGIWREIQKYGGAFICIKGVVGMLEGKEPCMNVRMEWLVKGEVCGDACMCDQWLCMCAAVLSRQWVIRSQRKPLEGKGNLVGTIRIAGGHTLTIKWPLSRCVDFPMCPATYSLDFYYSSCPFESKQKVDPKRWSIKRMRSKLPYTHYGGGYIQG